MDDVADRGVGGGPRSPDLIQQELSVLREELRAAMGLAPADEAEPAETVEEIDRVKAALLDAVAELDERRMRIEADPDA
ncbi:MAG: hypothetical protein ACRDTF_21485 [Pseudonocardiaceae bacterium]